jgi:hypothetical protein
MTVISISITQSEEQILAGIPRTVSVSTNIPSNIFYTLDGSEPTLFSNIYTGPIFLPIGKLSIVLNLFATDGVSTSPIITETFLSSREDSPRVPRAATTQSAQANISSQYPFGTAPLEPNSTFLSTADAGLTVYNPEKDSSPTGFDGQGNPTGFSNEPYNLENYNILYSTTDAQGQTGSGVGNLPATVSVDPREDIPDTTEQFSTLFNPKAFVIFQDFDLENPEDPMQINRQFFSLEDHERVRGGNNFFTSGLDTPSVNGSFLRPHYNPRDNTINYYYLDTWANKWIISKQKFTPQLSGGESLAAAPLSSRQPGSRYVFEWIPFARRVLF